MKKLMFLAVLVSLLSAWPACLLAQGLQKGDQLVSVFVGAGGLFLAQNPLLRHLGLMVGIE